MVRAATTAPVRRFGVLVIGSTNVCRSPAAERMLRARLGSDGTVTVTSVGTHAVPKLWGADPLVAGAVFAGAPSPESLSSDAPVYHLTPAVASDAELAARRLEPEMVEVADLVLTTSRAERAEVVRLVPGAVRRTFTLRELARVAEHLGPTSLPDGDVAERLAALVASAAPHRGPTAPADLTDDDVRDPAGRDERTHAASLQQVGEAVDAIVRTVRPGPDDGSVSRDGRAASGGGAPEDGAAPPRRGHPSVRVLHGRPTRSRPTRSRPAVGRLSRGRPTPSHPTRGRRSRTRVVVVSVLASIAVLVVGVTAGAFVVMDRLDDRVERIPDPFVGLSSRPDPFAGAGQGAAAEQPVTILVLGSADDVPLDGPQAWELAAEHTDVVMLARISADRQSAQLVTFPPDLAVDVPGSGPGTLRSAFAQGGPPSAVQTVEQLTDVRVDHIALTDSTTFAQVTEALGGVDLDVSEDLLTDGRVVVPAGRQRLTGAQALLWVQGTGEAGQDEGAEAGGAAGGRVERQQAWLRAILDRLGGADVRRDPTSWLRLLSVVSGSVAVDEGLDRSTMTGLLTSLRGLRPDDVDVVAAPTTTTLPDAGPEVAAGEGEAAGEGAGEAVVVPDAAPFAGLMDALRTDTLGAHLADLAVDRP
jgi:LCP family protein required for cell wall assembly